MELIKGIINLNWIILSAIFLSMTGNFFYKNHAQRKIIKIISNTDDEKIRLEEISKAGKDSWLSVLLLILIFAIFFILEKQIINNVY